MRCLFLCAGKLNRTEWRLRRRQENLGDFAVAIDKVFEEKDSLTMDVFFQVVAQWAGVGEDGGDETGETAWSIGTPDHPHKAFSSGDDQTDIDLLDIESKSYCHDCGLLSM